MAEINLQKAVAREKAKCRKDPVYFMRNHATIQHPVRGKIKFDLYPFQEDVLNELKEFRYNICLKSRQLGISTLSAAFALWKMVFNEDYNILVIATKQDVAKNLVTKVRVMNEYLPSYLKIDCIEDNKLSLKFSNGSQIKAVSSSPDAARSEALSLLIIDEAAFIPKAEEIWTSAQQTLSTGGSAFVLSTPNGASGMFYNLWTKAEEGGSQFNTIKLKWDVHPERDQKWRDEQDKLLGEKLAAQELDCDFITSGHSVVEGTVIEWYRQNMMKEPLEKQGFGKDFWIFEYPDYNKEYALVADVARGDGSDFSAFHIIDLKNVRQVAEYRAKIGTREYASIIQAAAIRYNNAIVVVENANVGWDVLNELIEKECPNLFYTYKNDPFFDKAIQLEKRYDLIDKKNCVPGFTTTTKTRPVIVSKLEEYFREKTPEIYSQRLLNELRTFSWINGKAEAIEGANDDLVMSFAIALWARDTALRMKKAGIELTQKTLDSFQKGMYKPKQSQHPMSIQWEYKMPDGTEIDLRELL